MLGCANIEPQHINHLSSERFRQLGLKDWDDHFIASEDNLFNTFLANDPIEHLNNFLGVVEVVVLSVALIPGL
jgi:hypothetical protein